MRPLVLLLHGYDSDEHDLFTFVPRLPPEAVYASLRAPLPMPTGPMNAWYPLYVQGPDLPLEGIDQNAVQAAAAAILRWVDEAAPTTPEFSAIGFSQGGSMAIELLRTAPDRCVTIANIGGFIPYRAHNPELTGRSHLAYWGRGDNDNVIPGPWVQATQEWMSTHTRLTERIYPGLDHVVSNDELADLTSVWCRAIAERKGSEEPGTYKVGADSMS